MTRFAGDSISGFLGKKPDFSGLGNEAIMGQAEEEMQAFQNNAKVSGAAMRAEADMASAAHYADAAGAMASAEAGAATSNAMAGAVSDIGGFLGKMGGGGAGSGAAYEGVKNGYGSAVKSVSSFFS